MKIDLYTKVVLTVIAACLVVIAVRGSNIVPPAHAAGEAVDVRIVNTAPGQYSIPLPVKIVGVDDSHAAQYRWDAIKVGKE